MDAEPPDPKAARLLVVDDEPLNVRLLERMLGAAGYTQVRSTMDPRQVLPMFLSFDPDVLLLDLNMPHLDGFQVMEQLSSHVPDTVYLPILVLTADASSAARDRALRAGAHDFLTKPFDHTEVLLRIENLMTTRQLHQRLAAHNEVLEAKVRARTRDLEIAHEETLERLGRAAEFRDDDTHEHTERVGEASARIALELGWDPDQAEILRKAAPLHDIGKIGTPDSILLKPGKLTDEEFEIIKEHVTIGARILSGSTSTVLQMGEAIALAHHERWDGNGYLRLPGPDIPLTARIVSVSDVFDALTHARPYKEAWPLDRALEEMRAQSGRQFDPDVLDAFLACEPWVDTL